MKKLLATVSFLALAAPALAQTIVLPTPSAPISGPMGQNDVIAVVPNGVGGVPTKFNYAGTVAGQVTYSLQVPLTAFTITPADKVTFLLLNPAGTLATGTLTMAAHPSDGQRFCLADTQTQTAITIAANTGQSLGGATQPTALVANTTYCWTYIGSNSTWYYQPGV